MVLPLQLMRLRKRLHTKYSLATNPEAFLRTEVDTKQVPGKIEVGRQAAAEKIAHGQPQNKERYDLRRKEGRQYSLGEQVLLRKNPLSNEGKNKKLFPKYEGPFQVIKILDNDRYEVVVYQGRKGLFVSIPV